MYSKTKYLLSFLCILCHNDVTFNKTLSLSMSPTKNIIPLYFAYLRHKRNNVNTYFHRFENQGRHTVHSHVLVWMKQLKNIALERIKATAPFDNTLLSHLVRNFFFTHNISSYVVFRISGKRFISRKYITFTDLLFVCYKIYS